MATRVKAKSWAVLTIEEKLIRWDNAERVLKNLPKHERQKHFDMNNWGVMTECGTVACAAGHCGMDPWFIKQGFKLKPASFKNFVEDTLDDYDLLDSTDVDKIKNVDDLKKIINSDLDYNRNLASGHGHFEGNVDVEDFFGSEGTTEIFLNTDSRSVNEVIKEIRLYKKNLTRYYNELLKEHKAAIKNEDAGYKESIKTLEENFKLDVSSL